MIIWHITRGRCRKHCCPTCLDLRLHIWLADASVNVHFLDFNATETKELYDLASTEKKRGWSDVFALQEKTKDTWSGSCWPMVRIMASGTVDVDVCCPQLFRSSSAGAPIWNAVNHISYMGIQRIQQIKQQTPMSCICKMQVVTVVAIGKHSDLFALMETPSRPVHQHCQIW